MFPRLTEELDWLLKFRYRDMFDGECSMCTDTTN